MNCKDASKSRWQLSSKTD